jgi:hypothetical protein
MALRGVRPRLPKEGFTYAEIGCGTAERLILLAACNPEGVFFGFDSDIEKLTKAATKAEQLDIKNVTFSQATAISLKNAVEQGIIGNKCFDYLVYDEINNAALEPLSTLRECLQSLLRDNGVFAYRYKTYNDKNADELLFQSLTRHILASEPSGGEALAKEWRNLCTLYFIAHNDQANAFDSALAQGQGIEWLRKETSKDTSPSKTIQTQDHFSGHKLTFLGSARLSANYLELSAPEVSHQSLEAKRLHPLYEAIKDLATGNQERIDLWGCEPLVRNDNLITLFGGFTFGTTESTETIARTVKFQGKSISFAGPLYDGIVSLASVMPVTMGDLVHHETLQSIDQVTLLNSLQLLVACGILSPMRSSYDGGIDIDNPKLSGNYNQSMRQTVLDLADYAFASTVVGRPVIFNGMNSLVLQTMDKGGLSQMAALLGDEFIRLAEHPYLRPLKLNEPQRAANESIRQIETAFQDSMVRWFSLGIVHNESM